MIKIFISHSSKDVGLAEAVIDLLRSALRLSAAEIRCTSVPGYKLPAGAKSSGQIRDELLSAPIFVGLVSEASLASKYVLYELGARWGADKALIPLMAPGIPTGALEGPLSDINAFSCASASDLQALVAQIGQELGVTPELAVVFESELEIVSSFPTSAPTPPPQMREHTVSQDAVDRLAELRSDAVHEILNRPVTTDAELSALAGYVERWWREVNSVLEKNFSKAEQLNFTRLGAVPNVIFPHAYNQPHAKILREYALQERRLLDIIARHTR
jgi:lambda repressor-like predicted transcriptional regulator